MNKPLSIAIAVIGVILLVYGLSAGDSIASNVKESVTGTPTDKSLWLIIGGVLCLIVGGFGLFRGGKA
ncbi:MAG TPA: DUF3185 family protein [Rariglobus sp.]